MESDRVRYLRLAACVGAVVWLSGAIAAAAQGPSQPNTQSSASAPIRGVVRALHQASISIDLPLRVAKLYVREAQSFRKGETLIVFDCKRVRAEHAAAVATSREMRLTLESQTYLESRGASGKLDVEIARARAEKAEAEAAAIAARLEQCTLVAPFDGRIIDLKINEHEVPPTGQPFIGLVDETHFEIDLILPSQALRHLEVGSPLQFRVDETGITYEARLLRIGAVVDPVSQSIKAIASFDRMDRRIVAGMSGTAVIPRLEAAP